MNDNTNPKFVKSSFSGSNGNCVEVALNLAREGGDVLVRDSKKPHGETLRFTRTEWEAFMKGMNNGEFNL